MASSMNCISILCKSNLQIFAWICIMDHQNVTVKRSTSSTQWLFRDLDIRKAWHFPLPDNAVLQRLHIFEEPNQNYMVPYLIFLPHNSCSIIFGILTYAYQNTVNCARVEMTLCWQSGNFVPILGLHLHFCITLDNCATFQIHIYLKFYFFKDFSYSFREKGRVGVCAGRGGCRGREHL